MLAQRVQQWQQAWRAEGLAEGRMEGRTEGLAEGLQNERSAFLRQAHLRFGAETATALAPLLERVTNPEQLTQIGEWIILCTTGADLLERTRTLADRHRSK